MKQGIHLANYTKRKKISQEISLYKLEASGSLNPIYLDLVLLSFSSSVISLVGIYLGSGPGRLLPVVKCKPNHEM